MAFGKLKSRVSPIGIDFGADSLKLLQIVPGEPPELVALGAMTVPEAARSDLRLRHEFLNDALASLLRKLPFRSRRVMLSIPAFQTLVHNLVVARTDPKDLDGLVDVALRERLGIEPTRMVIRNFAGADVTRNGRAMREVMTLAASRDVVMRYLDLAQKHKLELAGMHSEAPCLLRAFEHTWTSRHSSDRHRPVGYVDLGAATTKIVIARGSELLLAKIINVGGDQWTRKLAREQKIDFAEARLARVAEAEGQATCTAPPLTAAPGETVYDCEVIDWLVDELRMTLRHYDARFPDEPIEKLVFVGGEACRVQTCRTLAASVRVAAQLGDPFARLSRLNAAASPLGVDLQQPQPGWAVALGLCLSEANL